MPAPLGVLFSVLCACFGLLALASIRAHQWVIFVAALAIAAWFANSAFRILRRHR
jgi:hypothetical protein